MKRQRIFEILVLIAIFAVILASIQLSIIISKMDDMKIETHYRYLLPQDGQCKVKQLRVGDKREDRMVCHWELK